MSTDQPEGTEPSRPGRAPRVGDSRSPVGSTLSIVLAVVAVVAGFLILRTLNDDDDGDGGLTGNTQPDDSSPDATFDAGVGGGTSSVAVTTSVPPQRSGATIAVANASGVDRAAGTMSTALVGAQYQGVGDPGNGSGADIEQSIVYYLAGDAQAQAVAGTLARELGVAAPAVMPDTRPAEGGSTGTATVLVMLGSAQAGKPLAGASTAATTTSTTP